MRLIHHFDLKQLQQQWIERLASLGLRDRSPRTLPADLIIHETGAAYTPQGTLDYLWLELSDMQSDQPRRYFKVVCFAMLTVLPSQEREQSTLLLEMQKALKAVSTAQLDLVYVSANIRQPEDIGLVQIYGGAGISESRAEALQQSTQALATIIATLRAAYEQSRFEPLTMEIGEWLRRAFDQMLYLILGSIILFLLSGQAIAQPIAKHLIDAKPPQALLFDVEKWFQDHPIKDGKPVIETVFLSPRAQVTFIRGKVMILGRHIHSEVDELVYIYKGCGEYYINGKWVSAKAGQFHTCPRGVAHSSRAAEGEELWLICFFTEPLKPAGDRIMIDE